MKKCFVLIMLILVFSISGIINVNADTKSKKILDLPQSKNTKEAVTILTDPSLYNHQLKELNFDFKNNSFIPIYGGNYWAYFADGLSPDNIAKAAYTSEYTWVLYATIYKNEFIELYYDIETKTDVRKATQRMKEPKHLMSLLNSDSIIKIDGKDVNIEQIYCFDSSDQHGGSTIVYMETDMGMLVQYYDSNLYQPLIFSKDEFVKYAKIYYQELLKNSYNEKGEPLSGNSVSFVDVVNNNKTVSKFKWYYVIIGLVILSALGLSAFMIIHKKRQKIVAQEDVAENSIL